MSPSSAIPQDVLPPTDTPTSSTSGSFTLALITISTPSTTCIITPESKETITQELDPETIVIKVGSGDNMEVFNSPKLGTCEKSAAFNHFYNKKPAAMNILNTTLPDDSVITFKAFVYWLDHDSFDLDISEVIGLAALFSSYSFGDNYVVPKLRTDITDILVKLCYTGKLLLKIRQVEAGYRMTRENSELRRLLVRLLVDNGQDINGERRA